MESRATFIWFVTASCSRHRMTPGSSRASREAWFWTWLEKMGLQVVEGFFDVADIAQADEMFLTSTTREVVPIARVDGKPIGGGKPGPVTLVLLQAYRAAIERLAAED